MMQLTCGQLLLVEDMIFVSTPQVFHILPYLWGKHPKFEFGSHIMSPLLFLLAL